jgi:hypothetical protein
MFGCKYRKEGVLVIAQQAAGFECFSVEEFDTLATSDGTAFEPTKRQATSGFQDQIQHLTQQRRGHLFLCAELDEYGTQSLFKSVGR